LKAVNVQATDDRQTERELLERERGRMRERRHGGHAIIKKGRLLQYFLVI
jgi:hypothetical protein